MPQNDLGTAHGNIRLDFDDRASGQLNTALTKIHAQMALMNKRFESFEKTFSSYDKSIQSNTKNLDKATAKTQSFSKSIFSAHREVVKFSTEIKTLYADINKLNQAYAGFKDFTKPFVTGAKVLDTFQRTLDATGRHTTSFGKALSATGVFTKQFRTDIVKSIVGVDKAMRQMPRWTQDMYKFSGVVAAAGLATAKFAKFAEPAKIAKYLNAFAQTGPMKKFILSNEQVALSTEKLFRSMEGAPQRLDKFVKPFAEFGRTSKGFLTGVALLSSGVNEIADRFRWLAKIPKPILYSIAVSISDIIPAALKGLSKSLVFTSNLLEGMLDGVKQLSGGFLVLPGLFATIGAAVTPLIGVFSGLKKQFKDLLGGDEVKALQAYYSLPVALRPMARALQDTAKAFGDVNDKIRSVALKGIENDIKSLSDIYLPRLSDGSIKVVLAWRQMKDELVSFAKETQTQKDFSEIYTNTAIALGSIGRAIKPAAEGLRDISVVGNEFLRDMSGGLPGVTQKFNEFARANRENGKLLEWMSNAQHGVYDLIKGTESLAQGLWRIVTIFRTNTGGGFLDNYVSSMAKLNQVIQKSAAAGFLNDLGNATRSLANNNIDRIKSLWGDVVQFFERVSPLIKGLANAFSTTFIPSLKFAMEELGLVARAFHALGLDTVIGLVFGLISGWTAFSNLCVPLIAKLKIIGGLFLTITNASKITNVFNTAVISIASWMEKLGPLGKKASNSFTYVANSMSSLVAIASRTAAVMSIAAIAIGSVWLVMSQGQDEINKYNDSIKQMESNTVRFGVSLHKAFIEDRGFTGHSVMTAISQGLDQLESDMKNKADSAPGIMAKLKESFSLKNLFSRKEELIGGALNPIGGVIDHAINGIVNPFEDAKKKISDSEFAGKAVAGFEELRKKGVDIKSALGGTDEEFGKLISNLKGSGENANAAAAYLEMYRISVKQAQRDAAELGQAGAQAAIGFDKLANAAGDAQSKLEGLKIVLEALGVLKTSSIEAASQYADAIEGMSKKIDDAIESGDGLNNVFKNGTLNVDGSQTARNLTAAFGDLSNAFLNAAAHGGNVDDMLSRVNGKIDEWSQKLGVSKDVLKNFLATSEGLSNAEPIKLLVQLDKPGVDEAHKDLIKLLASLDAEAQTGVHVNIAFNSHDAASSFDQYLQQLLGKDYFDSNGSNLTLKAGIKLSDIAPGDLDIIRQELAKAGVSVGNTPVPVTAQPTVPVQPAPAIPQSQTPNIVGPGGITPPTFPAPLDQGGAPPIASSTQETPQSKLDAINAVIAGISQSLNNALVSVDQFTQGLIDKLSDKNFLGPIHDAGVKFGQALAQGLTDSQADAFKAAEQMAQGIRDRFHQSPPKKGPLSAHGDAAVYAGKQFVKAYSAGLSRGGPVAAAATAKVAASALGGVAGGTGPAAPFGGAPGISGIGLGGGGSTGSGAYAAGYGSAYGGIAGTGFGQQVAIGEQIGKQLSSFVQFLGHAIDAFSKLANVGLQLGKLVSDPLGEGKFFGKSLGQLFGYVRPTTKPGELSANQRYQDRLYHAGVSAAGGATRFGLNNINPLTGLQNALPGQLGPNSSKDQIIAGIVAEGQRRGLSPEQIAGAVATASVETGGTFNPLSNGGIQGGNGTEADRVLGLYQEKASFGTPEQRYDPNGAIQRFYDRYIPQLKPGVDPNVAATLAQNPQLGGGAPGSNYADLIGKRMADSLKQVQSLLANGGAVPSVQGALPGIGLTGGLPAPGILHDTPGQGVSPSQIASRTAAALVASLFPQITNIGGARPDSMPYHKGGRAIDIMIPGGSTMDGANAQGKALGDQIKAFFLANAQALGVEDTIWQDFWQPPTGQGNSLGRASQGPTQGHYDHVHITFAEGAVPNIGPQGSNLKLPLGNPLVVPQSAFGAPNVPGVPGYKPGEQQQLYTLGPDGKWTAIPTPAGAGAGGQGLPQGARLTTEQSAAGLIVKDQLTGKTLDVVPNNITAPVEIKDPTTDQVLGRVMPGGKPNESPFVAPPENLNPATGQPYTQAESQAWQQQHPLQYTFDKNLSPQDISSIPTLFPGGVPQSQDQLQSALPPSVQQAYAAGLMPGLTPQQASSQLQILENQKQAYLSQNDPQSRYMASIIDQQQQDVMSQNNLQPAANPFDTVSGFLGQASGVAGDIINTIQAGIDAVNATQDIADTLNRGFESTKDVTKTIDNIQKYITLAADIAQTTGDTLGTIAGIAGAAGGASGMPGGDSAGAALSAASQVADLISAGLQLTNAFIDLGQEGANLIGAAIAPQLQRLVGGPGGGLTGDVKFLLDNRTNELLAYSQNNPLDKRAHDLLFQPDTPNARNQLIGNINVYGGPGSDPRDDTRQMMFQVQTATLMQATGG